MSFRAAAADTPEISNCYQPGLQALGAHSTLISLHDTRACEGSVSLDRCLERARANENRWDYTFGYKNEVFFVEVHPADTSDVGTVINKLNWLRAWLANQAPALNVLRATTIPAFHWIHTGRSHIIVGSRQYFKAAGNGILPKARLEIRH